MSEHDEQSAFFEWVRYMALRDARYELIWAVPNAARRSWGLARRMKAEGLTAGVPDVTIAVPCGGYHGMFIEFKHEKNTTTEQQKAMLELLANHRYLALVAYSADQAVEIVQRYFAMGSSNGDFNRPTNAGGDTTHQPGEGTNSSKVIYLNPKARRIKKR